jgi:GT2 family glycosyltransferase
MPVNFTMLTRNRFNLTRQAVHSLTDSECKTTMDITILDDRSEPKTLNFLEVWSQEHKSRLIMNNGPLGTGVLRNAVIRLSGEFGRGDYLYLSDNDVFFHRRWLDYLIDCYEAAWSRGCRVLGGVGHPYHQPGESLGICSFDVRYGVYSVNAQPLQSMLMRWEVWDKYGPFCDTPVDKVCQSEDVDMARKIVADGFKLGVVSPALVVNTGITNSFGAKIPGWELVKAQCPSGVICE